MAFKKRKIREAEIPSSSMADIAFLLLLFFLVSTTIDVDTGIGLTLPEYIPPEQQEFAPLSKDRLAALLINASGDVLLNNEQITVNQVGEKLKPRIESKINLPKNKKLVVSVKTDRKTNYDVYVQVLDRVKGAYFQVRDDYSRTTYGRPFKDLPEVEQKDVRAKIPIIISIAEPEAVK
jgi:biopolymer transport protein ExbD